MITETHNCTNPKCSGTRMLKYAGLTLCEFNKTNAIRKAIRRSTDEDAMEMFTTSFKQMGPSGAIEYSEKKKLKLREDFIKNNPQYDPFTRKKRI